jgi:hypothetical protein
VESDEYFSKQDTGSEQTRGGTVNEVNDLQPEKHCPLISENSSGKLSRKVICTLKNNDWEVSEHEEEL